MKLKLQTELFCFMGGAAFLIAALILFASLWYMTRTMNGIEAADEAFSLDILQKQSRDDLDGFRHALGAIRSRLDTMEFDEKSGREQIFENMRSRFRFSFWTDQAFFVDFNPEKKADDAFRNFIFLEDSPDGIREQKTLPENSILRESGFHRILLHPLDYRETFLYPSENSLWIVHIVPVQANRIVYAIRFKNEYVSGHKDGQKQFSCLITDAKGEVLQQIGPHDRKQLPSSGAPAFRKLIQSHENTHKDFLKTGLIMDNDSGAVWILASSVLRIPFALQYDQVYLTRCYGYEELSTRTSREISRQMKALYSFCGILCIAGLLVMLIPLFLIAKRIAAPILDATRYAANLADGRPVKCFRRSGIQEINDMQKALNCLGDRMNMAISKLKKSHDREMDARQSSECINRIKTDLIRIFSRDMQTPRSDLAGFLDFYKQKTEHGDSIPAEELNKAVTAMQDKIREIDDEILLFLNLAAMDQKIATSELTTVDTYALLRETSNAIHKRAARRNISVEAQFDYRIPPTIIAESEVLLRSLTLLLEAITDAAPDSANLIFGNHLEGGKIVFWVRGNAEIRLPYEYELYMENSAAIDTLHHPLEIACLVLARYFAASLGGEMTLETSQNGFLLNFILPLYSPDDVKSNPFASSRQHKNGYTAFALSDPEKFQTASVLHRLENDSAKIMILEPDPSAALLIQMILNEMNASGEIVSNVKDALPELCRQKFDLLILSLEQKNTERFAILQKLRNEAALNDLKIIAISDCLAEGERDRLISHGATCCIQKPVNAVRLSKEIAELINSAS